MELEETVEEVLHRLPPLIGPPASKPAVDYVISQTLGLRRQVQQAQARGNAIILHQRELDKEALEAKAQAEKDKQELQWRLTDLQQGELHKDEERKRRVYLEELLQVANSEIRVLKEDRTQIHGRWKAERALAEQAAAAAAEFARESAERLREVQAAKSMMEMQCAQLSAGRQQLQLTNQSPTGAPADVLRASQMVSGSSVTCPAQRHTVQCSAMQYSAIQFKSMDAMLCCITRFACRGAEDAALVLAGIHDIGGPPAKRQKTLG